MQAQDISTLSQQVLWAAFGLSALVGAVSRYSNFCALGAVADVVSMGDWSRARMWLLAVGTAMMGFGLMAGFGWIDPARSFYTAPRLLWLSAPVGGLMFGFGMALASGCGGRALVRMGAGNLKSLVVLLVMAVVAYASLRGITAVLRVETVDRVAVELSTGQNLPALLADPSGIGAQALSLWLGLGAGLALAGWVLTSPDGRSLPVLVGGLGVGLGVTGLWWVSGVLGFVPEHPATLEPVFLTTASQDMESFSFVAPLAQWLDWLLFFSDKSKLLTLGAVLVVGMPVGSLLVALWGRNFRWEGFRDVGDLAHHMLGGALMGVGGVTAMGCTFGQALSGLSTLSVGSVLATLGLVVGALLGLRYQIWRME